eukprot:g3401.t1
MTTCNAFKLDLQGEFGTCKNCGKTQSEHKSLRAKANWSTPKNSGGDTKTKCAKADKRAVCSSYAVDLFARDFGTCKVCGFPQSAHRQSLKRPGQLKGATLKHVNGVRGKKKKQQQTKTLEVSAISCTMYKVDLNHPTGYGVCVNCGKTQAEHKVKRVNADLAVQDTKEFEGETKQQKLEGGRNVPKSRMHGNVEEASGACAGCTVM